jgi:hypothetical protein
MTITGGSNPFVNTATDNETDDTFESGDLIDYSNDGALQETYIGYYQGGFLTESSGSYYFNSSSDSYAPGAYALNTGPMPICFQRGTRLLLADGSEKAVEDLAPGDLMATADGAPEPVLWAGCTTVPRTRGGYMPEHMPIRIRASALGDNLPVRDLVVSPGHAIAFGEIIVPARILVNGRSIVVDFAESHVQYWHVRLPRHALLISEGVASESFKHHPKYKAFDQAADYAARFPDDVAMTAEQAEAAYPDCMPRVRRGHRVGQVAAAIVARLNAAVAEPA